MDLNNALSNGIIPNFLDYRQSTTHLIDIEKIKYNSFVRRFDIDIQDGLSYIPNINNIIPNEIEFNPLDHINEIINEAQEYHKIKDYYKNYVLSQLKDK